MTPTHPLYYSTGEGMVEQDVYLGEGNNISGGGDGEDGEFVPKIDLQGILRRLLAESSYGYTQKGKAQTRAWLSTLYIAGRSGRCTSRNYTQH